MSEGQPPSLRFERSRSAKSGGWASPRVTGETVIAYIDGGARGNPGPAAYGVRIENEAGLVMTELKHFIGVATNNIAEYRALIAALEYLLAQRYRRVEIRSDSELLVRQMLGEYRVKQPMLQKLHDEARKIAASLELVVYRHIPRIQNMEADRLVNQALDEHSAAPDPHS